MLLDISGAQKAAETARQEHEVARQEDQLATQQVLESMSGNVSRILDSLRTETANDTVTQELEELEVGLPICLL